MPSKTQLPLFPDFEQLLSNFNDEGVDYLLIGGYAVMVHAQPRAIMEDVNEAGLQVPIICAADLITNKLAAGRLQDLADVEAVRQGVKTLGAQQKEANALAKKKDE